MSFFDEDDEPPRTARTRTRPSPPPRRGRVTSGASADAQTVLVRRMIAGIVGVLILLALFFLVRACNNTRHDNALRDYNRQVTQIATQSRDTGGEFFEQLNQAQQQSGNDLYQAILGHKGQAEVALKQARDISVPGGMEGAQQSLLIALELRRDALQSIADSIRTAMGDEGEKADQAITDIAADMRALDASDVLYDARVRPLINATLKDAEIGGQDIPPLPFLKEISWVSPQFVATKLGQQLSSGREDGDGNSRQPTGPGLHGTGINATSYGNQTLQPTEAGQANRLTYVKGQPFFVSFTNQGENDEFNVKVQLKIETTGGSGKPITLTKTVEKIAQGEKATVELPLNREPPLGSSVNITVTVAAVPGEKKTDNNKSTYPTLFVQG